MPGPFIPRCEEFPIAKSFQELQFHQNNHRIAGQKSDYSRSRDTRRKRENLYNIKVFTNKAY